MAQPKKVGGKGGWTDTSGGKKKVGVLKGPTPKQRAESAKRMADAERAFKVHGTVKDAGTFGGGAAKASKASIKRSKVKVTTKQKQAAGSGKTTVGRMGTEGRYTRGEARPRTGKSPDYGEE